MPKNNAKPWEAGGKENGKKKTSRNKPPRNKNDKLSKERFSIFFDLNDWNIEIINSFKWEYVSHCCLISAKVRYCGADGEEVWYD